MPRRIFFTLLYLCCVLALKKLDLWHSHFYESGANVIFYHGLRTLLLLFIAQMVLIVGRRWQSQNLVHQCFAGLSIMALAGTLLAAAGLLTPAITTIVTLPLVFLSRWEWRAKWEWPHVTILVLAIFLFLVKGLPLDSVAMDTLGHYLPYYESVLERGGTQWPTPFYLTYFFARGAGLHWITAALSDLNAFQLVSFLYFLASAAVVYELLRLVFREHKLLCLALTALYLTSTPTLQSEFQKLHVAGGAMLLYLFYAGFTAGAPVLLAVTALLVMTPMTIPFVMVILGLHAVRDPGRFSKMMAASLAVFIAILGVNYLLTGIAEVTPFGMAHQLSDPTRRPAGLLLWNTWYRTLQEGALDSPWTRYDFTSAIVPGLLALTAFLGIYFQRKEKTLFIVGSTALSFLVAIFVMGLFVVQYSFGRGLAFLDGLRLLLVATLLNLVPNRRESWAALAVAILICFRLTHLFEGENARAPRFALGLESFASFLGIQEADLCAAARSAVGAGKPLLLLHFQATCYGNPTARLERPDMNAFNDEMTEVFLRDPETAKAALKRAHVDYFLYVPGVSLHVFALLPLFQPEVFAKYFGVYRQLGNAYVLTWREDAVAPLPNPVLDWHRRFVESPENRGPAEVLRRFRQTSTTPVVGHG